MTGQEHGFILRRSGLEENLTVEVGCFGRVTVNQRQRSNPRAGQVGRYRTTQTSAADDQDVAVGQALLAGFADFGEDGLALVSDGEGGFVVRWCLSRAVAKAW